MGYKKAADGPVVKKGKTDVQIFPADGKKVIDNGPKATKSSLNKSYKAVGRNMARANNQRGR
jgi:hypothetical protein